MEEGDRPARLQPGFGLTAEMLPMPRLARVS
jgi:hypothetical protein